MSPSGRGQGNAVQVLDEGGLVREGGAIDEGAAWQVVRQTLLGLAHIHAQVRLLRPTLHAPPSAPTARLCRCPSCAISDVRVRWRGPCIHSQTALVCGLHRLPCAQQNRHGRKARAVMLGQLKIN